MSSVIRQLHIAPRSGVDGRWVGRPMGH